MADTKISALPAGTTPVGTEEMPGVQSAVTVKFTINQLATFAQTGNAASATILATGRTLAITGDITWTSPSFNGSANVTATGTLATVNSNVGTFGSATAVPVITVNGKGLVTALSTAALGTIAAFAEATAAEYRAATASRALSAANTWAAAAVVALTDAATIAVDMATFLNASVTLGGNRTLGNPTNPKVGQSGFIRVTQDGTGSRTLAYASNWEYAGGIGTIPALSTAAGSVDVLTYLVLSATEILITGVQKAIA